MSIINEIQRILQGKHRLINALDRKGYSVELTCRINDLASIIDTLTLGEDIIYLNNPSNYLSFKFITDGTVTWQNKKGDILYSKDGGTTWILFNSSTVNMTNGEEIWFKGDLTNGCGASLETSSSKFYTTGQFYTSGNIQSLCSFNNTLQQHHFSNLFRNCGGLNIETSKPLLLPATTLTNYCYSYMFSGCVSLTRTPILSATTLAPYCYQYMFLGCTLLMMISELSAMTLTNYCYFCMFKDCTSLTVAPVLPATTLATYCYANMFQGCTKLTTLPSNMLPATTLVNYCYYYMFSGCSSLISVPSSLLPAITLANLCYQGMFSNCTLLTIVPELPATTLAQSCYYSMFLNCTSLTSVPSDLLPATTLEYSCYYNMFCLCTSLVSGPSILPATTLAYSCCYLMFAYCSKLTTAPILPAKLLVSNCYSAMFYQCTSLRNVTCLAVSDISYGVSTWLYNVASRGTFTKACGSNTWSTGTSGIPSGWTVIEQDKTTYLTFISTSNNNVIGFKASNQYLTKTIYVSTDEGSTWTSYKSSVNGTTIATLNNGDKILLRGNNTTYGSNTSLYNYFTSTGSFVAKGNIMSLIYNTNFSSLVSLSNKTYAFIYLFKDCVGLTKADELLLPATTLAEGCYSYMFSGCTSLTVGPSLLPATSLSNALYCYTYMFNNCTSLTTAPILCATTVSSYCCYYMFSDCTALTTIYKLPATNLTGADYCYACMFKGCAGLTTIPSDLLPATVLSNNCYSSMFLLCTSLTNAPIIPAATMMQQSCSAMFYGCTSLVTVPSNMLPATTLAQSCYSNMFLNCSSLTTAPNLPALTLANDCYWAMFKYCYALNYVKAMFTSTPDTNSNTTWWLYDVASSGTFVKNSAATWTNTGYHAVPSGWTVITASS